MAKLWRRYNDGRKFMWTGGLCLGWHYSLQFTAKDDFGVVETFNADVMAKSLNAAVLRLIVEMESPYLEVLEVRTAAGEILYPKQDLHYGPTIEPTT